MFWVKKDSQKQMPKIDFSKKGENTYFKTHNRLFFAYFFNRRPIWKALINNHKLHFSTIHIKYVLTKADLYCICPRSFVMVNFWIGCHVFN